MFIKRTYKVVCPLDGITVRDMPVDFTRQDGELHAFPMPSNGCDCMPGGKVCDKCRAAIILYLYKHPLAREDLPIRL